MTPADEAEPEAGDSAEEALETEATPEPEPETPTPEGDAAPDPDAAAPTEPGAATEADAEAGAVPEDTPENAEEESSLAPDADAGAEETSPADDADDAEAGADDAVADDAPDGGTATEADPAPEATDAEPAGEPEPDALPPPSAKREKPTKTEKRDMVPGADLEPIAISEEREMTTEERARAEAEAEERAAREARATAADDDEETVAPRAVSVPADAQIQATGKRKSAVARVIVRSGNGAFEINDRPIEQYFPSSLHQLMARQALVSSGYDGNVDVRVRVHGGGISGQAGAVRHGVARALTELEPELRGDLKRRGMLTRDDRRKERKKAGLKKARKRPQFSKR